MNLMRATLARAACGMSSRFASPRMIFRSKDFRVESWPGLKNLWFSGVFGYVEPGRTTAATDGMREPPGFQRGASTPLFPRLPHRFGPGRGGTLFGDFRLFGVHIPLKTMDIPRRKIAPMCLESGRSLPAPFLVYA